MCVTSPGYVVGAQGEEREGGERGEQGGARKESERGGGRGV